jgi:drug/metabolite transporter (DMT)-like permease
MPFISGLMAAVIWGAWIVVTRMSSKMNISAFDVLALRFFVACVLLSGIAKFKSIYKKTVIAESNQIAPQLSMAKKVFLAVNAGLMNNLLLTQALFFVSARYALIYYASMSIFATVSAVYKHGSFDRYSLTSFVLILIAVVIIMSHGEKSYQTWIGYLLFILAAVNYFTYTVVMHKWSVDVFEATKTVSYVSFVLYLPFYSYYLLSGQSGIFAAKFSDILLVAIYQGCCVSVLALFLYSYAIRKLGSNAAFFSTLAPTIGYTLSSYLLDEYPTVLEWIVLGLFIISMVFNLLGKIIIHRKNIIKAEQNNTNRQTKDVIILKDKSEITHQKNEEYAKNSQNANVENKNK